MSEEPRQRRFLRDKRADVLRDETEYILDQLAAVESKVDLLFEYIRNETLERLVDCYETLHKIECAIDVLRKISPPPNEAINFLAKAATDIETQQRKTRDCLTALLETLRAESGMAGSAE